MHMKETIFLRWLLDIYICVLRYMPAGSPIFPLLGERRVQNYGTGVENLHFHNFMEIGFCYYGDWILMLGENEKYMIEFANRIEEGNVIIGTIRSDEELIGILKILRSGGTR